MKSKFDKQMVQVRQDEGAHLYLSWKDIIQKLNNDKKLCLPNYQVEALAMLMVKGDRLAVEVFLNKIGWTNIENQTNRPISTMITISSYEDEKPKKPRKKKNNGIEII